MKVYVEKSDEHHDINFKGTAMELMEELDVNPEAVLVIKNGDVVTEDEELNSDDKVEFISIVSGG